MKDNDEETKIILDEILATEWSKDVVADYLKDGMSKRIAVENTIYDFIHERSNKEMAESSALVKRLTEYIRAELENRIPYTWNDVVLSVDRRDEVKVSVDIIDIFDSISEEIEAILNNMDDKEIELLVGSLK